MLVGRYKLSPQLVLGAAFGGTSVLNYAYGLAMGWLLAPAEYGLLAFIQALLLVGAAVIHSGFTWSLVREVAKANGPHERDALVRGALLANLTLAAAVGVVLVVLFTAGPLRGGFERWSVLIVVVLWLPFISLLATTRGCVQGSERFGIFASLAITEIFCKTLSGVALVLLGFGAFGAIAGFLCGTICAAVLGWRRLTYSIGVRLQGNLNPPNVRASLAIFGTLLGLSMLLNLDLGGLKLLSQDNALVGYYQAGLVLSNAPYYLVVAAVLPVLFPQLARHNNIATAQKTLGETLSMTITLVLPFEIALMAFPRQALVTFFPDIYALGAPSLRILAIGNILLILAAIFSATFQAVGRARVPALILLLVVIVELFALWVAIPSGEEIGAAWVFVMATSLALFCLLTAYLRESDTSYLRQVASWVIRYILAIAVGLTIGRLALDLGVAPAVVMGGGCYLVAATLLRVIPLAVLLREGTLLQKLASFRKE